ncbi:hypothetical protein EIP91_009696 [Steccherinum ochraceum]|uniref:DUF7702 domain-containing protein n=1 Tax=Steccherinum ochraceum TaxID=92696 RepID=A0A4R0RTC7_9APHY|nr:hypothetical protein EIP91_009696 [Steccherinum ochraceum]
MGLSARGIIALGQLIVYVPIVFVAGFLVFRHGFSRGTGWIFLLTLSIVRIVSGAMLVATEQQSNPSHTIVTIATVLESAGLSPLTQATLGFLNSVRKGFSYNNEEGGGINATFLLHIFSSIALALIVIGGSKAGNAKTHDDLDHAMLFRHIGVVLFFILYILIALLHGYYWSQKRDLPKNRRMLLAGISLALPFLFVRIIYAVLSGFAPVALPGDIVEQNSMSKFNSTTGPWWIYLIMSALPEVLAVVTYIIVGIKVPVEKDFYQAKGRSSMEDGYRSDDAFQPAFRKP